LSFRKWKNIIRTVVRNVTESAPTVHCVQLLDM